MMGHDLIRPDSERHGALRMTEAARPLLRDENTIALRLHALRQAAKRPAVKALIGDEDAPLLSALKAKRRALAEARQVPAYIIFHDRTLIELAELRPETLDQMAAISGVGAKKLTSYGAEFLQVINAEVPVLHPQRRKLAGRKAATIYDCLMLAQANLTKGLSGTEKPLNCSASLVAKVAALHNTDRHMVNDILGEKRAELFADAFLDVLQQAR